MVTDEEDGKVTWVKNRASSNKPMARELTQPSGISVAGRGHVRSRLHGVKPLSIRIWEPSQASAVHSPLPGRCDGQRTAHLGVWAVLL